MRMRVRMCVSVCVCVRPCEHKALSYPDNAVGIATRYGFGLSRGGAKFSAPVQTGSVANPSSCTVGTGSFPG